METQAFQTNTGHGVFTAAASSLESDYDEQNSLASDVDSAIGSSTLSTRSQSLTSSVLDFPYLDGRRFHAYRSGQYHLPNDEPEQDRLDLQHYIFRTALDDKLFIAPLSKQNLLHVLDVGCGTGIWCIEVADENPQALVRGIDLSPIQPAFVPPNCSFLVDDCNEPWDFPQKFDLIHLRAMTMAVNDMPAFLNNAYNHLNPGGFIEWDEFLLPACCTEATASATPLFVEWSQTLVEATARIGKDFTFPKRMDRLFQDAGFTNINIIWQHWPIGAWPKGKKNKTVGRYFAEDLLEGVRTSKALFTKFMDWGSEEYDVYAAKIAEEIRGGKQHMWIPVCFAYAQRPTF